MAEEPRACVTGMGLVSPIGPDVGAFWDSLVRGRSGVRPVRSFDTSKLAYHLGCEVPEVPREQEARRHSLGGRCAELALAATFEAVESSGLGDSLEGRHDVAVVVGTTMGDVTGFEQRRAEHPEREADLGDLLELAERPMDVMGASIARRYGLSGSVLTVPTACAAGAYAIGIAASLVRRGEARVGLAIGCEAFSRLAFLGFARLGAMAPDACRPFSRGRQGLLLGEGAAALVIEREHEARRRGAPIVARIEGFGLSCDAFHVTGPHPEGHGAARALARALAEAGVAPELVDYVNAHGTGTALNDRMESLALRSVLGTRAKSVPVSSIKALTGHTMGAAGAIEAVATLLALRHGVVPPTWNWLAPDPDCQVDCVPNEPRESHLRCAVSNSYAFGGNNASLVFTAPSAGRA
jgi:3-oxoacyl-[acyl-carrier-protein] synthase II